MNLRAGIVGLPNVGKSTLFNALLKKRVANVASYPFATVEPNVGLVAVPDERLQKLAELVAAEKFTSGESKPPGESFRLPSALRAGPPEVSARPPIVPAAVEFVDIAGLVKGAHQGAGLGNQFLSHIREVDAIVHVLRDFEDTEVAKAGAENPVTDKLTVETELGLADLQTLEKLISAQESQVKMSKDQLESEKLKILKQVQDDLNSGKVISRLTISDERLANWFEHLPLLSIKPVLYVYNVDESRVQDTYSDTSMYHSENELVICAKLEEELVDLSEADRMEYLKQLGVEETGLERLIKKAYRLLGLISFFTTTGKKEIRAWTIKSGTKALQAAGVIHTDFEKNFIRAQVIEYQKLVEAGSYATTKQKGLIRTEGKDYVVKDGDVIEFLVSR